MAVLDAIANNITSLANGDLVYVAEDLGGGSYQDGKAAISVVKSALVGPPLTLASGTLTDPSTALTITQTWNDAADTFKAVAIDITNTNSAAASTFVDMTVGGSSIFNINRAGTITYGGSRFAPMGILTHNGFRIHYDGTDRLHLRDTTDTGAICLTVDQVNPGIVTNGFYGFASSIGPSVTPDTTLFRDNAGIVSVRANNRSTGGALNFLEQTAPSAPATDQVVVYAEDNGSGKTRLMARFATGAAQVLATEP